MQGRETIDRHTFYKRLQVALVSVTEDDFIYSSGQRPKTPPAKTSTAIRPHAHTLIQTTDKKEVNGQMHSQRRVCKVCSVYKVYYSVWDIY